MRRVFRLLALVGLSATVGCGEVQLNWQRTGQLGSGRQAAVRPPEPGPVASQPAAPPVPAARTTASRADPLPQPGEFFQLVLLSRPAPQESPPGIRNVRLQRASAGSVGEILRRLYLPVGMQGRDRCLLIYGTQAEWRAAADFVPVLDVEPAGLEGAGRSGAPVEEFRRAVAALMGLAEDRPADREVLRRIAERFGAVALDDGAAPLLRWAASMLAADVYAGRLYEYPSAEQMYVAALTQAAPGSVEYMNTLYGRARAHLANGRPDRAQGMFAAVVAQFTAYRQSEVYQRSRKGLERTQAGGR